MGNIPNPCEIHIWGFAPDLIALDLKSSTYVRYRDPNRELTQTRPSGGLGEVGLGRAAKIDLGKIIAPTLRRVISNVVISPI